jgi:segregation and condensation protein A
MFDDAYSIKIDIFEGPMDLLVYLVRKNDVDIYNIPVAMITEQYLAYLDLMELMNIDYAGDFLYMAATLAHIKSKMLLPSQDNDDDEEDPRMEIARPLLEYLRLKSAADYLTDRDILGRDTFAGNPPPEENDGSSDDEQMISIGLFELVEAFRHISEKEYKSHSVDFSTKRMSVKDRIIEILAVLEKKPSIQFHELLENNMEKHTLVLTFLAILEMAKLNLIEIRQHIQNGMITVCYV